MDINGNTTINQMKQSFQYGVDSIYNAIVGQGTTPSGKTPAQIVAAIGTLATNKYNAGISNAKTEAKVFTKTTKFGYSTWCAKGDIVAMATFGNGLAWNVTNVTTLHHGLFANATMTLYRVNADGTVAVSFTQGSDYSWYLIRLHD